MAHTLQIIYGSTTINLTSGDYILLDYVPEAGKGGIVTERIRLFIKSSSAANFQTAIENIERALRNAESRYDTGVGDKVYIKFQPDSLSTLYRSEIVRRSESEDAGSIEGPKRLLGAIWATKSGEFLLIFTRRDYWEANTETTLTIENQSGSGTSVTIKNPMGGEAFSNNTVSFTAPDTIADSGSGFGVFSAGDIISLRGSTSNDGIYTIATASSTTLTVYEETVVNEAAGDAIKIYYVQNYVDISSSNIGGTEPTPIKLKVTNTDAGADLETVWVGMNRLATPLQFGYMLEVEDCTGGSNTVDAGASSLIYRAYNVLSGSASALCTWTLPSGMLNAARGAYVRAIMRFWDGTDITNCRYALKIYYDTNILWESGWFQFDDTYEAISRLWREFATFQLPPFRLEGGTPTDLTLKLWSQSVSGSDETINLDVLQMVVLDGWRKFVCLDGIAQNSILVDDGIDETFYQEISGEQVNNLVAEGSPLMLMPNQNHRIQFTQHSITANTADIDRTASVTVIYRPRIRTF